MPQRQVLVAAALLALFAILLPMRLPEPRSAPSADDCGAMSRRRADASPTAVALLEQCAALFPDDVELIGDLAAAYDTAGRPAAAEAAYERALARDPDAAEFRLRLGRLYLRRGASAKAAEQAARALQVEPNRDALLDLQAAAEAARDGGSR